VILLVALQGKIVLVTGAGGAIAGPSSPPSRPPVAPHRHRHQSGPGIDATLDVTSEADWQRVIAGHRQAARSLDGS